MSDGIMIDIKESNHTPTEYEMSDYIKNKLWDDFCDYLKEKYHIHPLFTFSKCSMEYGWNIKFKKGSRAVCTVYPRQGYFCIMIVVGTKEKAGFEEMMHSLSDDIIQIYRDTREWNGQRWLLIDLEDDDKNYQDVKRIIDLRMHK